MRSHENSLIYRAVFIPICYVRISPIADTINNMSKMNGSHKVKDFHFTKWGVFSYSNKLGLVTFFISLIFSFIIFYLYSDFIDKVIIGEELKNYSPYRAPYSIAPYPISLAVVITLMAYIISNILSLCAHIILKISDSLSRKKQ